MTFLDEIQSFIASSGINLLFSAICALIFVLIGFKLSNWLIKLLNRGAKYRHMDESARTFINSLIGIGLKVLIIFIAASIIGIDGTALASIIGTAGVAIGLAMQGSLSNLAGGVMILLFRPFKVGDFIDNHTDSGTVTEIGVFYTVLRTVDNKRITVPNGALSNATVINYSAEERRRVDLEFSVAYSTDHEKAMKVMETVVGANSKVLKDPAPFVGLVRQDSSALVYVVRAWCDASNYWDVYFDLNANMKIAFDKVGIEIPFNQLDVHVTNR